MADYYADRLSAEKLRRCYEIAPPRVRQYLRAELDFALGFIHAGDAVLDLGCGYGRTLSELAARAGSVTAVDNAPASVALARETAEALANVTVLEMDAAALEFPDGRFDVVLCLQNGISAFHRDQRTLLTEALRVCRPNPLDGVLAGGSEPEILSSVPAGDCRPGGTALFSTYAARFWEDRLQWFRLQSEAGLLGEIDWRRTKNGSIACKDGFTASTVSPEQFRALAQSLPADVALTEVDGSSLFCILRKSGPADSSLHFNV